MRREAMQLACIVQSHAGCVLSDKLDCSFKHLSLWGAL